MIGRALRRMARTDPNTLPGRLLRLPLALVPRDALLPVVSGELRGMRWTVGASTLGCWLGTYEHDKQRLFARVVAPGASVWDVGANAGFYTLLAARLVGPGGAVHAFEPLPANVALVRRHVSANALPQVTVHAEALGDRVGTAPFQPGGSPETGRLADSGPLQVRVTTADHLLRHGKAPPPDVVKIDVEGAEAAVLAGARALLAEHRPRLLVAIHSDEARRATRTALEELGYEIRALDGRAPSGTREIDAVHPDRA